MGSPPGRKTGRFSQAVRLVRLLDHLRAHHFGVSLSDLAHEFDISERQVRRDLSALGEAQHPVEIRRNEEGRAVAVITEGNRRAVSLTTRERYALLAVRRAFDVLGSTPLREDVRSIFRKIVSSMPATERAEIARFADRFHFVPDAGARIYRRKGDILDGLLSATLHRVRLAYTYAGPWGPASSGVLEPYSLVLYRNGLYVVGLPVEAAGPGEAQGTSRATSYPRVYAAERFVKAVHLRGQEFSVPRSFRLEQYFQGAFGIWVSRHTRRVVVDFAPAARPMVEARVWHRSQRLRPLKNGGVRAQFALSDLTQVRSWILGWGPQAKAIAPEELVEAVRDEARLVARQYRRR